MKKGMIDLVYIDDCIIISSCARQIDEFVYSMQHGPANFILTDEGDVNKFLGVEINQHDDSSFKLSQPFLNRTIGYFSWP